MNDIIACISTAPTVGAISIVRVSGNGSINLVDKLFSRTLLNKDSHTITYGHIMDNNEKIDEVLVSVFKAPKTYTKEDIVEINCHGGHATTEKILELLLDNGARLAEPGEFTKRAYLNGRIDLLEAEAVSDLISSKTELTRKMALNGVGGKLSKIISELRGDIALVLANIEVNIDYPEYIDEVVVTNKLLDENIIKFKKQINNILTKSKNNLLIKNGIKVGLFGKPNVGKSSLLNKLIEEEKAIVTNIEGTTRDVVESSFKINDIIINLYDTAGIRKTDDVIEQIGVKKSLEVLDMVDLVILVLDSNQELSEYDKELLEITKNKTRIIFINKNDLNKKIDIHNIVEKDIVYGNTVTEDGLNDLKNKILEVFNIGKITEDDLTYISNARTISILKKCNKIINEMSKSIKENIPVDMIELDLKEIWNLLGEIIGENYSEELIDTMFKNFCLGK